MTIIIPVYNAEKYLAETLDSIVAQSLKDIEIIVVDDASIDSSPEIIGSYCEKDDRIRYIRLDENQGMCGAFNVGIEAASSEYITFSGHDDVSLPDRLKLQAEYLDEHREISVVGVNGYLTSSDLDIEYTFRFPLEHDFIVLGLFIETGMMYQAMAVRAELLRSVGGYNASGLYGEDWGLVWRMVYEQGARLANIPENLYMYRRHEGSLSDVGGEIQKEQIRSVKTQMFEQLGLKPTPGMIDRNIDLNLDYKLKGVDWIKGRLELRKLVTALVDGGHVSPQSEEMMHKKCRKRLGSIRSIIN